MKGLNINDNNLASISSIEGSVGFIAFPESGIKKLSKLVSQPKFKDESLNSWLLQSFGSSNDLYFILFDFFLKKEKNQKKKIK